MLADYSWPGNVRELRHTIERACAAAGDGTQLFTRHLPTEIRIELARKRLVHLSEPEESAPTAPLPEQAPSTQPRKPETFPTLRDMKAKAERDYIARAVRRLSGRRPPRRRDCRRFTRAFL